MNTVIQIQICTALLISRNRNQMTDKLGILNNSQSNKIETWCSQKIDVHDDFIFLDRYCSTVQGLLDWFEEDLGFTKLLLFQTDFCVMCVFVLYPSLSLSSCPFLDILHCLPRPLESALNLVGCMSSCGTYATYVAVLRVKITCAICYYIADDSSIHRGTYHILKST